MIHYRPATVQDARNIALLHARNWQQHYRGILRKDYLDKEVVQERLKIWARRLAYPTKDQHVILAEYNDKLCGFACTYLNKDRTWGTLLDNLHVVTDLQGRGIGKRLMQLSAQWLYEQDPNSTLYLFVLKKNKAAIRFYDRIKGERVEEKKEEVPGGGLADVFRYVWRDVAALSLL